MLRVAACGVCGSDLALCARDEDGYMRYAGRVRLPLVPGHEFAGEVVEVGPGVQRVHPGAVVTCDNIEACGHCAACKAGATNQCTSVEEIGFTKWGGLAEYATVPERCCFNANPIVRALGAGEGYRVVALVEPAAVAYQGFSWRRVAYPQAAWWDLWAMWVTAPSHPWWSGWREESWTCERW